MSGLEGQTVGFIGLGLMGKPMARNLKRAGATIVVHNRSKPSMDELGKEGHVRGEVQGAGLRRHPPPVDVDGVAQGLEGVEADANG